MLVHALFQWYLTCQPHGSDEQYGATCLIHHEISMQSWFAGMASKHGHAHSIQARMLA